MMLVILFNWQMVLFGRDRWISHLTLAIYIGTIFSIEQFKLWNYRYREFHCA